MGSIVSRFCDHKNHKNKCDSNLNNCQNSKHCNDDSNKRHSIDSEADQLMRESVIDNKPKLNANKEIYVKNDINKCESKEINVNINSTLSADNCSTGLSSTSSSTSNSTSVPNRKPSMDVTRHNFLEIIAQLSSVVNESQFIAIDTELSGLRREWKSLSLLDLQSERYLKLKESISGYQLIQFGLTCFKPIIPNKSEYSCHCYNFYIFPQKSSAIPKANGDRTFAVQSTSLTFLVNNGFDFNKLIRDGVSYLNVEEEKTCLEAIKAAQLLRTDQSATGVSSAVTDEDKNFVAQILDQMQSFISDDSLQNIDLSPCNGFKRKLIYEALKSQDFSDSIDIKTIAVSQNSIDRYIAINKINKEEKQKKEAELLTEAIGFSKVIQLLIKCEKPIIGHNVLLDIMHTFNQFIEPLPQDYNQFKQSIHALFPVLYDTKHIASSLVFKDILENTALGDMFERLKKPPFKPIDIKLLNGVFVEGKSMHEAGYDSYVTGISFIGLVQYLGSKVKPEITQLDPILMSDYRNKLYLTYAYDIRYLDFENEDIVPDRSHIFHVTFPNEWKTNELYHLFSAFGGVTISWINETSAFCALRDANNTHKINKSLVKQTSNTYKVKPYYDFVKRANISSNESIRDQIKQTSKTRASPQKQNPNKKTKVNESNVRIITTESNTNESNTNESNTNESNTNEQISFDQNKQKLFQEPQEWEPN